MPKEIIEEKEEEEGGGGGEEEEFDIQRTVHRDIFL